MIKVKVSSFLTMKEIIGDSEISLNNNNGTIQGLLTELTKIHGKRFKKQIFSPKTGDVKAYWIVVNGVHCPDLEHSLNNGDEVILYPAWAGG